MTRGRISTQVLLFFVMMMFLMVIACGKPAPTYSISGAVRGAVLSGVTIKLSGARSATTTTNASGNFSFAGRANGTYTVTPVKAGYTFTPTSSAVKVSGANITGTNFAAAAIPTTAPSAPTGVTATAGNGQVTISWNAVSGATSYNIYWSTTSGVTKTSGTKITDATSPYSHTGLTNGTPYYYIVTAVNSYGESSASNQVSATPSGGGNGGTTLRVLPGYTLSAFIDTNTGENLVTPQTLMAAGGSPFAAYTWSTSGFPMGTTVAPLTGVFSSNGGTIIAGHYPFTVSVSDGTSTATGSVTLNVTTTTPIPFAILQQYPSGSFALDDANANKPYGASLFAMGGTPPYSWSEDASYSERGDFDLSGLTIDQSSGIVRGTLFNSSSGKTLKFRVIVRDNAGDTSSGPVYTITVK